MQRQRIWWVSLVPGPGVGRPAQALGCHRAPTPTKTSLPAETTQAGLDCGTQP
jgi:hypothetical protein